MYNTSLAAIVTSILATCILVYSQALLVHVTLYSSQCSNNDDWIGSSSERTRVGAGILTLQSFDSCDVYEISYNNSEDTTSGSDPPVTPIVSTRNFLTSSATTPLDDGRKQLLFLYDCETTGGSHYEEHIIEIASAVMAPDELSITKMEFTSLCYTSRRIDPIGK